ncbi:unnamed protein product, partial [Allacma fusca]
TFFHTISLTIDTKLHHYLLCCVVCDTS